MHKQSTNKVVHTHIIEREHMQEIHHKLSLLLLLVLIAGLAGAIFLLRVPIAGLSSGCIGIVVFFLAFCGAFGLAFGLAFALTVD